MAWRTMRRNNTIQHHYREPGHWVFRHLQAFKPKQFDMTGIELATDMLKEHGENRRNRFDKKTKEIMRK